MAFFILIHSQWVQAPYQPKGLPIPALTRAAEGMAQPFAHLGNGHPEAQNPHWAREAGRSLNHRQHRETRPLRLRYIVFGLVMGRA